VTPRSLRIIVTCPDCGSPSVRKNRRRRRFCTIECKDCGREWKEIHDDGVVHGLVIIAPPPRR